MAVPILRSESQVAAVKGKKIPRNLIALVPLTLGPARCSFSAGAAGSRVGKVLKRSTLVLLSILI